MKIIYWFFVLIAAWLGIWLENNLSDKESIETWVINIWKPLSENISNTWDIIFDDSNISNKIVLESAGILTWTLENTSTWDIEKITHISTPDKVHSLYYTAYAAVNRTKKENLYNLSETTEINSVTIDIKNVSGYTSFDFWDYNFWDIKPVSNWAIWDIKTLIADLHDRNIYVIWRIVVFKDKLLSEKRPDLALKWTDDKTSVWTDYAWNKYLDAHSKEVWDYIVELSSASYELWFDEINFDYIRFPSDWYISKAYYPFSSSIISQNPSWWKMMVIDEFWNYLKTKLKQKHSDIVLSADVFWLVTNIDLFQIWQNLESFLLNFDFVWPMIYPSHYSVWYLWASIPDNIPYDVLSNAIKNTNSRIDKLNSDIKQSTMSWSTFMIKDSFIPKADISDIWEISKNKIRPWLQWFTCTRCKGATAYNREKFRQEVNWVYDSWLNSWWVWNSSSNYYPDRYNKE